MSVEHLDELIEKLNGGDVAAAERAFLAYEPYLRMAIRRQLSGPLRSKLDTMDIVQAVWIDVLAGFRRSGRRFADHAHLRAFLATLVRHRLIDGRRHYRRALEGEVSLVEVDPQEMPVTTQPRPRSMEFAAGSSRATNTCDSPRTSVSPLEVAPNQTSSHHHVL